MKILKLESTAPFQGLPELVADREGLFEQEGLKIEWIQLDTERNDVASATPKGIDPFANHGSMLEQGKADMYNACEWGNYCRVQDSSVGSRQIGRRAIVAYAAIMVRGDSPVFTPQQLADVTVSVPFYFGTHYVALQLLEGFLPRENISLFNAPHGSRHRYDSLMNGEFAATTLTEPYITLAEKQGCRLICGGLFHGTEVASDKVDAETYGAFNRAVRQAVQRINANKSSYMRYFIDYYRNNDADVAALKPTDLRESRLVVTDPAPIPAAEMQRTYTWLKSWDMLEKTAAPSDLVNLDVQAAAHMAAE